MAVCTVTGITQGLALNSLTGLVEFVPVAGVKIFVKKINLSGTIIQYREKKVATSNSLGEVEFELPRACNALIEGPFIIGSTDFSSGVWVSIPDAATADLEDLGEAVVLVPNAMAEHLAAADPHAQYLLAAEGAALITAHEAAVNPHPTYLTQAEGDGLYGPKQDFIVGDYASLALAVAGATAVGGTLIINSAATCPTNLTVPADVTLQFTRKGSISITTGATLTIVGPIQASPVQIFSNAVSGQGTVSFAGNTSLEKVYPQWWGAVGDGSTDIRAAAQAALDAVGTAGGGSVHFIAASSGYYTTGSLRPSSNTTVSGDGYLSQIKCPTAGWTLSYPTNYGIINIDRKSNVRVTGLRITGTNSVATATTAPKLIFLDGTLASPITNIQIDHNSFDTTVDEGIWQGGAQAYITKIDISNNYFTNIAYKGTAYGGLPTIQFNAEEGTISNNRFYQVGMAIGASGARITITGNVVKDVSANAISIGDDTEIGVTTITGNTVEFNEQASGSSRSGILLGGGVTNRSAVVSGNMVRLIGTAGIGSARCYYVENIGDALVVGNWAEIQVRGRGFVVVGTAAGSTVDLRSNTVKIVSESGTSLAFNARPNGGGQTLNLISSDNHVYGISGEGQGSFAYDYRDAGGGTLNSVSQGDCASGGYIATGSNQIYQAANLNLSNVPVYDNASITAYSAFLSNPLLRTLSIAPPVSTQTIASGVITITGAGVSIANRQTRLRIDTESAAASDDLDTINGGLDGDILILQTIVSTRDVVVKDNTGNILCGSNVTLGTTSDRLVLLYDGGLSKWVQLARSIGGAFQITSAGTDYATKAYILRNSSGTVLQTVTSDGRTYIGADTGTDSNLVVTNPSGSSKVLLAMKDLNATGTPELTFAGGSSAVSIYLSGSSGLINFGNSGVQTQQVVLNTANNILSFGGAASASFPGLKPSSTTLRVRLANDSADAPFSASNATFSGYISNTAPVTKTADFTWAATENWIIADKAAGTLTATLPAAASFTGRTLVIKTIQAQTVVSASSNVVPQVGGAAGTAILAATAGKWARLISDGSNWIVMESN